MLVALVLPSVVTWLYFFQAERLPAGAQGAVFGVVKVLQFAFPAVWMIWVARRPPQIKWPGLGGVAIGVAFGLVVAGAMLALYYQWLSTAPDFEGAEDAMEAKLLGFGLTSAWKFAALGVFYSLCHSLLEEYYWRWFVFGQLQRFTTFTTAMVVSSLGFMAHHVLVLGKYFGFDSWQTWAFSLCVAVGGGVWAWLYKRTGSLLGPWISHLIVDAAIFWLGFEIGRDQFIG